MSDTIRVRVSRVINNLPREYRVPVAQALGNSDGTEVGFASELTAMGWDIPDLPVDAVLAAVLQES